MAVNRGEKSRKSILITGGAGFIGSSLAHRLHRQGNRVIVVDNLITGRIESIRDLIDQPDFSFFEMDIISPDFFRQFQKIPVDEIYHLACPTGVPNIKTMAEAMLLTSSVGTFHVLELSRIHHSKLVFSSTAEVYGQSHVVPISEDYHGDVNPIGPRSPYEEGKRFSEAVVMSYVQKYGVAAKIVRIFNTYGQAMSQSDSRVIPSFLNRALNNQAVIIYGDGEQTRSHLYIDDLLDGLQLVMGVGGIGNVYNIGSDVPIKVKTLAKIVIDLVETRSKIIHEPHFIEDHRYRCADNTRISMLGWKPVITLESGLKKMAEAYGLSLRDCQVEYRAVK